ncbi:MAG: glycosyltransferase family 39 protein [Desulfobacteraceae bacterium]|nr:glycosyltransferase family 39 protein [Desulfobacteraceae bacterium]
MRQKLFRDIDHREIWFLAILVLLTSLLRMYKLGSWSLWVDEAFTIHDALHSSFGIKPINYLLVRFFLENFGVCEWTARMGPAIVGIFSIPVSYYFFKELFDRQVALLGSLFLSFSSWHIYWSQNARHYSLVLLFAVLCLWFFYRGFERDQPLAIMLSVLFLALGTLTHPSILFLCPALLGYLLLILVLKYPRGSGYNLKNVSLFVLPITLAGAGGLPIYLKILKGLAIQSDHSGPLHIMQTTAYYVQIPFITLAFIVILYLVLRKDKRGLFLALVSLVPLGILTGLSFVVPASSLYIYYTLPIYCVSAGYFIKISIFSTKKALDSANLPALGIFLILIFTQLSHVYFYFTYQYGDRPRWKEAAQFVSEKKKPGDAIISTAPPVLEYYFLKNRRAAISEFSLRGASDIRWFSEASAADAMKRGSRIWFVSNVSLRELTWVSASTKDWLEKNLVSITDFPAWTGGKNRTVKVYHTDCSHQLR